PLLTDVADLEGEVVAELLLDREIPLLDQSGPEVLVKDADTAARVATELRRGTRRSALPCLSERADACGISGLKVSVWKIERKLLVASASLHIGRGAVGGANDGLAVHEARRPGDAEARIPIAEPGVVVVERTIAVATRAGDYGFNRA